MHCLYVEKGGAILYYMYTARLNGVISEYILHGETALSKPFDLAICKTMLQTKRNILTQCCS